MELFLHFVMLLIAVVTSTGMGGVDRVKSIVEIAKAAFDMFKRLRNGGEKLDRSEVEHIRDQLVLLLKDLIKDIKILTEKVEENTFAMRTLNQTIQEAMEGFSQLADLLEKKYDVPADNIRALIPRLKKDAAS